MYLRGGGGYSGIDPPSKISDFFKSEEKEETGERYIVHCMDIVKPCQIVGW